MKLRIEIHKEGGELLAMDRVPISTHPDHIRLAKDAAAELVEQAVNVLIDQATTPWPTWAQQVGESDLEWQLRMNRLGVEA